LTLRCARCHDHKFDPVTKEDYYALYGIFASTQFPWAGGEEFHSMKKPREHFVPLLPPEQAASPLRTYQQRVHQLEAELQHSKTEGPLARYLANLNERLVAKERSIAHLVSRGQKPDALKEEHAAVQRERDRTDKELKAQLAPLVNQIWELHRSSLPAGLAGIYAIHE